MKTTLKILSLLPLLSGLGHAAISITGVAGTSFKAADGTTNIPVGSLFLVVADTGTAGFLSPAITAGVAGLTTTSDPDIIAANASITAGGTFGGDKIVATGSIASAGVMPGLLTSATIADYVGLKFAVIWFSKSAATLGSEGLAGQNYGIIAGADWTFPAADAGNFSFSSTDATPATNYYSFSTNLSAAQLGATGFFTGSGTAGDANADIKAATFQIVAPIPEPSAALLGALGALGLLRRRRI